MVTGANSGIGKELASFLAAKQATVYVSTVWPRPSRSRFDLTVCLRWCAATPAEPKKPAARS